MLSRRFGVINSRNELISRQGWMHVLFLEGGVYRSAPRRRAHSVASPVTRAPLTVHAFGLTRGGLSDVRTSRVPEGVTDGPRQNVYKFRKKSIVSSENFILIIYSHRTTHFIRQTVLIPLFTLDNKNF